jgi:anti-sigma regulatory factor (Ser/Thr protein kinase)
MSGRGQGSERLAQDSVDLRLNGSAEAPSVARRALGRLRGDIDPPVMETMRLLVTELVSNSVKHSPSDSVRLKVAVGRSGVLVEVTDQGSGFEHQPRNVHEARDSGWGLFLVERLAHRWGIGREGSNTRVWFELRRTG